MSLFPKFINHNSIIVLLCNQSSDFISLSSVADMGNVNAAAAAAAPAPPPECPMHAAEKNKESAYSIPQVVN